MSKDLEPGVLVKLRDGTICEAFLERESSSGNYLRVRYDYRTYQGNKEVPQ